jgi:hypothetical protein
VLNLSGNKISDLSVADALSTCPKLRSLSLAKNPITKIPQYNLIVTSLLPKLELLDGSPVDRRAASKVTNSMIMEAASMFNMVAGEEKEDELRMEGFLMDGDSAAAASESSPRAPGPDESFLDTGSELTHGDNAVLAGNVALAMRRKRQQNNSDIAVRTSTESDMDKSFTEISTIDVLDSALRPSRNNSNKSNKTRSTAVAIAENPTRSDISCFIEGDITMAVAAHYGVVPLEEVLDASRLSPGRGPSSRSPSLTASAASPQTTSHKRPPSRASRSKDGVSSSNQRESSDRPTWSSDGLNRPITDIESAAGAGGAGRIPRPSSAASRKQPVVQYNSSGRPVSRAGIEDLASVIAVVHPEESAVPTGTNVSRNNSIRSTDSKPSSRKSSFSDAAGGSSSMNPGSKHAEHESDTASIDALYRLRSPYQHNSSRPQSASTALYASLLASSSSSSSSSAAESTSAPFMVLADESDRKPLKQLTAHGDVNSVGAKQEPYNGHTKSIVHLDMVRSSSSAATASAGSGRSEVGTEDSDEETQVNVFKSSFSRALFQPSTTSTLPPVRPGSGSASGAGSRPSSGSKPLFSPSASNSLNSSRPGSASKPKVNSSGGNDDTIAAMVRSFTATGYDDEAHNVLC